MNRNKLAVLTAMAQGGRFRILDEKWYPGTNEWGKNSGVKGGYVHWDAPPTAPATVRMVRSLVDDGYIARIKDRILDVPRYELTDKGRAAAMAGGQG